MKYNLTLTKETAPLLIKRIEKMLYRKGQVYMNHKYVGAQKQRGYVQSILPAAKYPLLVYGKSNQSIISKYDVRIEADNDTDMQLVRINWQNEHRWRYRMGAVIPYGTKLCIHSQKISYKGEGTVDGQGMLTTISI